MRNCRPEHLDAVLAVLDDAGVMLDVGINWIRLATSDRPQPFHFTALPYPGVPTDLQAPFTALAALADGKSIISDRVFPHRFGHVAKLNELGTTYRRDRATAVVKGVDRLHGGETSACDLRSAAALVLAGLATVIHIIHRAGHLGRGHAKIADQLRSLGAKIEFHSATCYNSDDAPLAPEFQSPDESVISTTRQNTEIISMLEAAISHGCGN